MTDYSVYNPNKNKKIGRPKGSKTKKKYISQNDYVPGEHKTTIVARADQRKRERMRKKSSVQRPHEQALKEKLEEMDEIEPNFDEVFEDGCSEPEAQSDVVSLPERQKKLIAIKDKLIEGKSDAIIQTELGLGKKEFKFLKSKLYSQEIMGFVGKSAEEQFIDYRIEQEKCLKDLDKMVDKFETTKQHNAMVGAIGSKSRIIGDIHKTAAAMGMIKQDTTHDREIDGVMIEELSNNELRVKIADEVRKLQKHIKEYQDKDMVEIAEQPTQINNEFLRSKR